ncbi:MAG: GNAT family N-acetyltransferase [Chlamydiales bacterium]|nr:GNAT family N-acetyltransferase [Chlamydiales bacterium]
MKNLRFEMTTSPKAHEIDFLTQKINEDSAGLGKAFPFAILARDESGKTIAGCNGSVIFGSIHTDQLWVHSAYRGKGIGARLMDQVHEFGRENRCKLSTVSTMSFQAPGFYKKLGYAIDFSREGYDDGATYISMSKKL